MKKIKFSIFSLITLLLLLATGCSSPKNIGGNISSTDLHYNNTLSYKTRSENIKNSLSGIEGLNNVTVAVEGKTALIGIDSSSEKSELERIKKEIRRRVLIADNGIETIDITSNSELFQMIERLNI